jgi:hypothetical protein
MEDVALSDANWHGTYLTEDEIVEDLLSRLRADPKALKSWMNAGPAIHFTAGMTVRNWYGLWRKDCPLTKPADGEWLAPDADDVSARIIKRVLKVLAGEAAGKPEKGC